MTLVEVMNSLQQMGTVQTKLTFIRHGAQEPLFGVKVGDLKKLVKQVKKDQNMALALYATGNSDAMYLAGLSVNPKTMMKETLQSWAAQANWSMLSEYTVAGVAAESRFALELAREWIESEQELIAACGWSTYANYISIISDDRLDIDEIRGLFQRVKAAVHEERNRVRYVMNSFVIVAGSSIESLHEEAMNVAAAIGKVHVDVGQTECKVPLASEYIQKVAAAAKLGVKKKTCIC